MYFSIGAFSYKFDFLNFLLYLNFNSIQIYRIPIILELYSYDIPYLLEFCFFFQFKFVTFFIKIICFRKSNLI